MQTTTPAALPKPNSRSAAKAIAPTTKTATEVESTEAEVVAIREMIITSESKDLPGKLHIARRLHKLKADAKHGDRAMVLLAAKGPWSKATLYRFAGIGERFTPERLTKLRELKSKNGTSLTIGHYALLADKPETLEERILGLWQEEGLSIEELAERFKGAAPKGSGAKRSAGRSAAPKKHIKTVRQAKRRMEELTSGFEEVIKVLPTLGATSSPDDFKEISTLVGKIEAALVLFRIQEATSLPGHSRALLQAGSPQPGGPETSS